MDDNKIAEEIGELCLEMENTTLTADDHVVATIPSNEPTEPNLNKDESDLHVIYSKRQELDSIQRDLDDLVYRLNSFITDSQSEFISDVASCDDISLEEDELYVAEKQDGPPEKELRLCSYASGDSLDNKLYTTDDGSNPPEINWDTVGPILQKHVADLQRLHSLNQMTNAVVKRIRNVAQINDSLFIEAKGDDDA